MLKAQSLVESITRYVYYSKEPSLADVRDRCFDDATYSDLTIVCGDKSWKVHRVVVCSQSKVLHAACMTGFKVVLLKIIHYYILRF